MEKLTIKKVEDARENIKNFVIKTSLTHAQKLSLKTGGNIYLKLENFQNSGSFKMRGACNKILQLTESERKAGVIASSAGNHAQGVSYSAKKLGIDATIVMPKNAPLAKVSATLDNGASVVLHGNVYDDAYTKAVELQKEKGNVFIHPFDDIEVIAGQGTVALEVIEQLKDIDVVYIPVGGGGLIAGMAYVLKETYPNIKIIGVQTENAPSMAKALEVNSNDKISIKPSIADGIAVAKPGDVTFELVKKYVDEIILVSDIEIAESMLFLLEKCNIISEGAGSVVVAALLKDNVDLKDKNVVGIISGGNIDVTLLEKIINRALISTYRRKEYKINLKDQPGRLAFILSTVSDIGANIFSIRQGRYRNNLEASEQALTLVVDTRDKEHQDALTNKFIELGIKIIEDR